MDKLSLQDAFKDARNIVKSTSPKATTLFDFIVSKSIVEFLNLCHGYLRWVDDIVDDRNITLTKRKIFINRQKQLIKSYWNDSWVEPEQIEEYFIFYFVKFALQNDLEILVESVYNMVDTISWDVYRLENDGIFTKAKLDDYVNIQSQSINAILFYFINELNPDEYNYKNLGISNVNAKLFMFRDLEEDIDAGLINIPREDIKKFNLDVKNLKQDKNLNKLIEQQIKNIIDNLYIVSTQLKQTPLKTRLIHFYVDFYYLPKIIRFKVYGFYLGSSNKKNVYKEINTFWQSFRISVVLFKNIFLKAS
ncbi:MAG: hypothetical protein GXO85_15335 [Chlorobi bacterium]|nr:hypothetical protein [Chlorobiota bacterium]